MSTKQLSSTGRRKPPAAGMGRKKGSQNKVTKAFKEALLEAFHDIGGTRALTKWGKENPTEFYKIAARLIPTEVVGSGGGPVDMKTTVVHEYRDRA